MKKFIWFFGVIFVIGILGFGIFVQPGFYLAKSNTGQIKETDAEVIRNTPLPKKVLKEYWSRRLPKNITFLVFKLERILEVWSLENQEWQFIESYPILAASGTLGPKLREGDCQVPEGIYKVIGLNPNSNFCRSLLINYPNEFDRAKAKLDGRNRLGGSICVHGSNVSIGCIAMGDEVSLDLYWLASRIGMKQLRVIIAPYDFRKYETENPTYDPPWTQELYEILKNELKKYKTL